MSPGGSLIYGTRSDRQLESHFLGSSVVCFQSQPMFGRGLFQGPSLHQHHVSLLSFGTEAWFVKVLRVILWRNMFGSPTVRRNGTSVFAQMGIATYLSSLVLHTLLLSLANFMLPRPSGYHGSHSWRLRLVAWYLIQREPVGQETISSLHYPPPLNILKLPNCISNTRSPARMFRPYELLPHINM